MAELTKLLSALIKGHQSFEQVNAAVQRFLARSPEKAPQVAKLLRAARDAGLPHPMFVSLGSHVTSHMITARDPEATVLALDDGVKRADIRAPVINDPTRDAGGIPPAELSNQAAPGGDGSGSRQTTADPLTLPERDAELQNPEGPTPGEATRMESGPNDDPTGANGQFELATTLGGQDAAPVQPDDSGIRSPAGDVVHRSGDTTDKTAALGEDPDFDFFSDESLVPEDEFADADTGANWPTIRDTRHPSFSRALREGDHLRDRFQLVSKLGEGGMGAVWKGKDLLKAEARDRDPFVAIKLLQGDFKEHPEAFIALQRETVKQQRLAHPNIATVYDFDRDDSSNTVFMTMEVLEGEPLDAFIRKLPPGGLAVEEAMPLIEQLCNGLGYAHSHGLVHADLKPGNCFYTKDGTIKLLDFGIARASKTKAEAEGETTLFDPVELGALTPTYATVEMFEGIDPDPRDDIYALAIMTYQLLTGKHPYGKRAAPKARELNLKPEPIAKLTKRQNKALMRGLALEREDRTPSVEEFFESVRPRKNRTPIFMAAGVAAIVLVGVGAYDPGVELVNQYRREQIISMIEEPGIAKLRMGIDRARALDDPEQLELVLKDPRTRNSLVAHVANGGEEKIDEMLSLIASVNSDWQRTVKNDEQVKAAIVTVFDSKIQQAWDPEQNRYDYAAASALISELDRLYPGSAEALELRAMLNHGKATRLAKLRDDYRRYLEEGRLMPVEDSRDIGDVVEEVRVIDPQATLLEDGRLRLRYVELIEAAIEEEDYERARALLKAGLAHAPGDPKLRNLSFRLEAKLQRIADEGRVTETE